MLVGYDSSSDSSVLEDTGNENQKSNNTINLIDVSIHSGAKESTYITDGKKCLTNDMDGKDIFSQGNSKAESSLSVNHFKQKFEKLKMRRLNSQSPCIIPNDEKISKTDKKTRDPMRKKFRKRNEKMKELNNCIPMTFLVCNEYDPHNKKKSKIEKDLDSAIAAKDFQLAESINKEMTQRTFATTVKSAMEAHNYIKLQKKNEQRKRLRKKEKLHWSFNQKQRWETKGNM